MNVDKSHNRTIMAPDVEQCSRLHCIICFLVAVYRNNGWIKWLAKVNS